MKKFNLLGRYVLNERGEPVPEPDLFKWAAWMEQDKLRVVKQERVGKCFVSTVFLGLSFLGLSQTGAPILWETMVFECDNRGMMMRCAGTREQAEAMHVQMVKKVKHETRKNRKLAK